jgi:hypothetical protein
MMKSPRPFAIVLVALGPFSVPFGVSSALAQDVGNSGAGGGGSGGAGAPATGTTVTSQTYYYPGGVAPTPPGKPLGGGNVTGSSSMPKVGDETDNFDLTKGRGGASTVYGRPDGYGVVGDGGGSVRLGGDGEGWSGPVPDAHVVKRGDTLWRICDTYYQNPYLWPRIWSYNPQIQNPHWIYPGDVVRLREGGTAQAQAQQSPPPVPSGSPLVDRRRRVGPGTIFLRERGYIDDTEKDNWGSLAGANVDKMFLTDGDEVYLRIGKDHEPKLGQELAIFRPIKKIGDGWIVSVAGTVRIDRWDSKERVARARIVETLDVIERGARVGPIQRTFQIVPPVRNDAEVKAKVIASLYPHVFYGQNQLVFIDKGSADGLKAGNRLFVIRRGDEWRKSLASDVAGQRMKIESPTPADAERIPKYPEGSFPEEVVGEIRVVSVRPNSSTCVVTQSTREIEQEDFAYARKGY